MLKRWERRLPWNKRWGVYLRRVWYHTFVIKRTFLTVEELKERSDKQRRAVRAAGNKRRRMKYGRTRNLKARYGRKLALRDGLICSWCSMPMVFRSTNCTVDHVIPVSKGGKTVLSNLQLLHRDCNLRKADQLPTSKKKTAAV